MYDCIIVFVYSLEIMVNFVVVTSAHSAVLAACHPSVKTLTDLHLPSQLDLSQFNKTSVQGFISYLYTGIVICILKKTRS